MRGKDLSERIYKLMKTDLMLGHLKSDEMFNEQTLADRYGCSRTPVREAAGRLVIEGYLNKYPSKGYIIRVPSENEVRELRECRYVLECSVIDKLTANASDEQIRALFLRRMSLALEVAQTKAETDDKIYKPDREAEIIEKRTAGMDEELRLKYTALLQSMIRASREYQYSELLREKPERFPFHPAQTPLDPKTVYYQGVPGAYQELAARALFPHCEPQHVPTWEQVFRAVRDGEADVGVVPVENTTAGTISEVYDLLLEYGLCINRS